MRYRCHIERNHALQTIDVYVYESVGTDTFLLVPERTGYLRERIDPGTYNPSLGPTISMREDWAPLVLSAWLESEHGHTGSEQLLSDRLGIETRRVDKLMDKLMEQI